MTLTGEKEKGLSFAGLHNAEISLVLPVVKHDGDNIILQMRKLMGNNTTTVPLHYLK